MKNPFEKIFRKPKKENLEKAGRAALVAGMVSVAAVEGMSKENSNPTFTPVNPNPMHINYENPKSSPVPGYDLGEHLSDKMGDMEGGGDDPSFGEGNPITLASAYFETGTVKYKNPEARERAKSDIRSFLRKVDLKNSKIIVTGYSSKERPTTLNEELARQRTEEGLRLVQEVLSEDYPGEHVEIETVVASDASVYDDMSEDEREEIERIKESNPDDFAKLIDAKQAINVDAVTKTPKIEHPPIEPEKEPEIKLEDFNVVFLDESQSMANDITDVRTELKNIKEKTGNQIKTIILEGGSTEAHLTTLYNFLSKLTPGKPMKVLVLTDEPDNKTSAKNYDYNISHVLGMARDKKVEIVVKVFNPDRSEGSKGGFKTFVLNKPENKRKLLAPDVYEPGPLQQAWYNSL